MACYRHVLWLQMPNAFFFLQNLKPSAVVKFDNNFVYNFQALSCCYTLQQHLSHFNFG